MIYGIQFLRGLASLFVLCTHLFLYMLSVPNFEEMQIQMLDSSFYNFRYVGAIGVDIFFVISGFVIFLISEKINRENFAVDFLKHRFFRIYPIYWIVLFLYLIFAAMYGKYFTDINIVHSFLLLPYFVDQNIKMVIGVAWTLSYEIYFYFIVFILLLIKQFSLRNLIILMFSISVLSYTFLNGTSINKFISNPIMIEFILGGIVFYIYKNIQITKFYLSIIFIITVVSFCIAIIYYHDIFSDKFAIFRFLFLGIPSFFLILFTVMIEKQFSIQNNKYQAISVYLGDFSYPLYLTHFSLFIPVVGKVLFSQPIFQNWWIVYLVFLMIVICLSIAFFYIIDRPLEKLIKEMRKK